MLLIRGSGGKIKRIKNMKQDNPIHGKTYTIRLFYWGKDITAMFLTSYTDIFGDQYTDCFISDKSEIIEISKVESWILK